MNDREFEDLIAVALEAEAGDDPGALDPRTPVCLSMGRLETLGRAGLRPTRSETDHLRGCGICRLRLQAFKVQVRGDRSQGGVIGRAGGARWGLRVALTAAAAGLIVLVHASRDGHVSGGRPSAPLAAARGGKAVGLEVSQAPPPVDNSGADRFHASCETACAVMAVFRACDETCRCLDWELLEWDADGHIVANLAPEEAVDIALEAADRPPIGQLLVVASSENRAGSAITSDDANELLACLNEIRQLTCEDGDLSVYASAVEACLPASVTLVEKHFFLE